jgi:glycopeptide antibiotics resistance protein
LKAQASVFPRLGYGRVSEQVKLPHQSWIRSRFAIITLAVLALILYWTLYPFEFRAGPPAGPWRTLFSTFRTQGERVDIVANILLFVPLGFFVMLSLRRRPQWWDVAVATAGAAMLSTTIELLQFYDKGRQTTLTDVYSNAAGALLGAIAGVLCYRRFRVAAAGGSANSSFESLLLACWLGSRLYPYDLVLDVRKFWHGISPILQARSLAPVGFYRHFALWLAVALLTEAVAGGAFHRWIFAFVVMPGVLAARILIWPIQLSPEELAGGVLAAAVWTGFLWRLPARAKVVAVLFTGLIIVGAPQSSRFNGPHGSFEWLPFGRFLVGDAGVGLFLEKAFLCGVFFWIAVKAGLSWLRATVATGALVFGLALAQSYVGGRPAGITDLVILLMGAGTMRLLQSDFDATDAAYGTELH